MVFSKRGEAPGFRAIPNILGNQIDHVAHPWLRPAVYQLILQQCDGLVSLQARIISRRSCRLVRKS